MSKSKLQGYGSDGELYLVPQHNDWTLEKESQEEKKQKKKKQQRMKRRPWRSSRDTFKALGEEENCLFQLRLGGHSASPWQPAQAGRDLHLALSGTMWLELK